MTKMFDPIFCFLDFVRFSWGPTKKAVTDEGVEVEWQAEEKDKEDAN